MTDGSVARSDGFYVLGSRLRDFSQWWLSELRAIIPSSWLIWLDSEAVPRLLFWRDHDSVVCRLGLTSGPVETRLPIKGFGTALDA